MNRHDQINETLGCIRGTTPQAVERFTRGDCYQLYLRLKARFPDATPWYDEIDCHVLTELDVRLWDITGWLWSVGKEPPHVVPWEETDPGVRARAPHWKWKPNS